MAPRQRVDLLPQTVTLVDGRRVEVCVTLVVHATGPQAAVEAALAAGDGAATDTAAPAAALPPPAAVEAVPAQAEAPPPRPLAAPASPLAPPGAASKKTAPRPPTVLVFVLRGRR